ncbi:MAG: hypothetical protein ABSH42_16065 [Bryobacteraceae bacterium]|jgi:hypothetical protein
MPTKLTTEVLTAAIGGLEIQKTRIDAQIAEIRQMLDGGSKPAAVPSEPPSRKRRKMSKAGRAAIAAAQRKRWADSKRQQAVPESPKPKRKLSAAGRRAIIAATKKRWAAKRAEAARQAGA